MHIWYWIAGGGLLLLATSLVLFLLRGGALREADIYPSPTGDKIVD